LLIGLYQYFTGELGFKLISSASSFGDVMKNSVARFWAVEHISAMLIAIVLITVARRSAKNLVYKKAAILYFIALVLILAAVPWPFREGIARPWFPGMG
jgi:cell division protein FtsW (lipid II flippase)